MMTCLKYLIPISCALFLGAVLWPVVLASTLGKTTLFGDPMGERVRASAARVLAEPLGASEGASRDVSRKEIAASASKGGTP
jgi:NADH-quinone oxidoreductase subunit H